MCIISKKRMKLDFPEPLTPISTLACRRFDNSTSARDLKPRMRTDSTLPAFIDQASQKQVLD